MSRLDLVQLDLNWLRQMISKNCRRVRSKVSIIFRPKSEINLIRCSQPNWAKLSAKNLKEENYWGFRYKINDFLSTPHFDTPVTSRHPSLWHVNLPPYFEGSLLFSHESPSRRHKFVTRHATLTKKLSKRALPNDINFEFFFLAFLRFFGFLTKWHVTVTYQRDLFC